MTRLTLVRHGRAAAGWDGHLDPGLHADGLAQAAALAADLGTEPARPIVVSPLRRTRETAVPLAAAWSTEPAVDDRVAEIPSPTDDLAARRDWLFDALRGRWSDLGSDLAAWRDTLVAALLGITTDSVVVTHFVAINVAVGAALGDDGDDRLVVFSPTYCSRTVVEHDGTHLRVVELGAEAATEVR